MERFIDIGKCEDNARADGREERGMQFAADPYFKLGYSALGNMPTDRSDRSD